MPLALDAAIDYRAKSGRYMSCIARLRPGIPVEAARREMSAMAATAITSDYTQTKGTTQMINGAHVIVYTTDPEADRAFFRNTLGFECVDAGHGWLIFALPAAESAFHPAEENNRHELYLMCDDLKAEIAALRAKGAECGDVIEARWGIITKIRLPGGGEIGLYEPRHPRP